MIASQQRSRRQTLQLLGGMSMAAAWPGAGQAAIAAEAAVSADDETHPWIDAHSHIWTTDLKKYPLRDNQSIDVLQPRSFTDEELMAIAAPEGVGRVVLIQHHPHHGFDNSYLIDTWKKSPDKFRIVGQIDDTKPGVAQLMKDMLMQGVTGFRIGPRGDRSNWLDGDGMHQMWKTAVQTRQNMCCLINPSDISATREWCHRYPETPVVIDHFARIGMDGMIRDSDIDELCGLAAFPLVRIKISAYYAFGRKQPPYHDLVPMIKRLFECFGPDRLMWASDCPYQLGGQNSYKASISLIRDHLAFVNQEERRKLLRSTAESTFFRL
jgi:L-fuconolactonase